MTKDNLPEEKLLKLIRIKRPEKSKLRTQGLSSARKSFELKNILRLINALLLIAALALAFFLITRVFFITERNERVVPEILPASKTETAEGQEEVSDKKPFAYYKAQFSKRDLFERPLDQVAANASVDLTKRYKLVGIVLGDIPEAIVEDLTSKKTMFVREGERLEAVTVKTIEEGRIIFLQEGLEIELKQ